MTGSAIGLASRTEIAADGEVAEVAPAHRSVAQSGLI
jgi:hypothetical protein